MSARNGDKARYQINRKRAVLRRAKIRQMMTQRKAAPAAPPAAAAKRER